MKYLSIILVLILMALVSCRKEPQSVYSGKDGIVFYYIQGAERDSVYYSFRESAVVENKDTVWVKMRLIGKLSDRPRKIKVVTAEGTTAIEGTHYILPEINLSANSFLTKYPVVLLKHPDIEDKTLRLKIQVADTEELVTGTVGHTGRTGINLAHYIINFTAGLDRPNYWQDYYLGAYSDGKYEFIKEVIGTYDFGGYSFYQFINLNTRLNNKLKERNDKYGSPLLDENKAAVTFPFL